MATSSLLLNSEQETSEFARGIATRLNGGDTILLEGPIGAGKTHFCRALIQCRLAEVNRLEDVPSPTFTIVQTYELDNVEIWHADLYRLSSVDELTELGLDDAFESDIVLVEWPERLGTNAPANALHLSFHISNENKRELRLAWTDSKWDSVLDTLL